MDGNRSWGKFALACVLFGGAVWGITSLKPEQACECCALVGHVIEVPNGSGVVVAPGKVLTAAHVTDTWPAQGTLYRVTRHPELDLALVEMPTGDARPASLASGETQRGQKVFLIGTITGRSDVLTEGRIGLLKEGPFGKLRTHTCPAGPGTSGGGMFDEDGNLVGIHIGRLVLWGPSGPYVSPAEGLMVPVAQFGPWLWGQLR